MVKSFASALKPTSFFLPHFCTMKGALLLFIGAELFVLVLILALGQPLGESWDVLGLLSVFVQWIAFSCAAVLCFLRRWLAWLTVFWSWVCTYALIILTTALVATAAQFFLFHLHYRGLQLGGGEHFIGRCVLISATVAFVALRYFYVQYQWKQRVELESRAYVEALQARIRPHFLFNSMNIIASLIRSDPKVAEGAVQDLSQLFRATLRTGSTIPLKEEWALCQNYLRIETLRLGDRLALDADLSLVPADAAIPLLTLQPLIENAVYHGIQSLEKGGTIRVWGRMEGTCVVISLSNPVALRAKQKKGNRMAMVNIRHRLRLLFGRQAHLSVTVSPGRYEVTVVFPYSKSDW